jgi:hypothetical protein
MLAKNTPLGFNQDTPKGQEKLISQEYSFIYNDKRDSLFY